jgi:hypothetical protein
MSVAQVSSGFFGLGNTHALHQDAGDDLQAVRDAVIQFLEQHLLFLHQCVVSAARLKRFGDVGHGNRQARGLVFFVIEHMGMDDEMAASDYRRASGPSRKRR